MEILGIIASILGILAFFAISPNDMVKNFKRWFLEPVNKMSRTKKLDIYATFLKLGINDIRIENLFLNDSFNFTRFDSELIEYKGVLPENIKSLKQMELNKKQKEALEKGITLDNNSSYALRRIDISRPEGVNGKRENKYKLILETTDYFSFIFPNLCLDKEYFNLDIQENQKLREMLNLEKQNVCISTLENFPLCQFKIGTGTLLITKDNYLICSVRSKKQAVAASYKNELAIHLSTAEGMYRSTLNLESSDIINGTISPFATSIRSLKDELNLEEPKHFQKENLFCLGYFFDVTRAQPFFLFYLKVNLLCDEFFTLYSNSPMDIHENDAIFSIPAKATEIKKLFRGTSFQKLESLYPVMYKDFFSYHSSSIVRIASNHAKVGFATILFKNNDLYESDLL